LQPPIQLRPELLPLDDPAFTWPRFEAFCRALIALQPGVARVYHYGDQGDEQHGIDLIAELADGTTWAPQCKRYRTFTQGHARKVLAETTYRAEQYTLLLSCVATAKVRDVFAERPDWELWDARDIAARVRVLPIEVAARLVEEHFGPQWRAAFLGLEPASPFLMAEDFFAPLLGTGRLFHHAWELIGREAQLRDLDAFVGADKRAVLLPGRGGIGKSKLLHAFATAFATRHPGVALRFLHPGATVTAETLPYLPTGPCLLVIDDAHQREKLEREMALLAGHRPVAPLQVLLAGRPHATDRLRGLLTRVGFDAREIAVLPPLQQLARADVLRLAAQVLGTNDLPLVERLAAISGDSPLVTVVGGQLLLQRRIPAALLERDTDFRAAVLDRFSAVLLGLVHERIPNDLCLRLLEMIAALAPLQPHDERFREAASTFLGIDHATLVRHLGTLEAAGVLLRRGTTIRITPDVLADHLLLRACLNEVGDDTGYARRIFEHFGAYAPARLLANLAELDWRLRTAGADGPALLDTIWGEIEAAFDATSHRGRCRLLETLEDAAPYQPRRILALIGRALRQPEAPPDDSPWAAVRPFTQEAVRLALPRLLRRVAYTERELPRCLDLLWELGRDDRRVANQLPDHPMRVLHDLAEYELEKPVTFNRAVLDAVGRWLRAPDAHRHAHSPLDILDALLGKDVEWSRTEGAVVHITVLPLDATKTRELRDEALAMVAECATADDIRLLRRVVASLLRALRPPSAKFMRTITEEEHAAWIPEQQLILRHLAKLLDRTAEPIVHLDIAEGLVWHARHASAAEVRQAAEGLLARIPDTFEGKLTSLLGLGWRRAFASPAEQDEWERLGERRAERLHAVAAEFRVRFPEPSAAFAYLERFAGELGEVGVELWPQEFLGTLAGQDAAYVRGFLDALLAAPVGAFAPYLNHLLPAVRAADEGHGAAIIERIIADGHAALCYGLAFAYQRDDWLVRLQPRDREHLAALLKHDALPVRLEALRAIRLWGRHQPAEAMALAVAVDFAGNTELAAAVCEVFDKTWGIPLTQLSDRAMEELLDRMVALPSIDNHHICAFVTGVAAHNARAAVRFLLARVTHPLEGLAERYEALPHHHDIRPTSLESDPEYAAILCDVRDAALALPDAHWRASGELAELFKRLAPGFDATALAVLSEWIDSNDPERIMGASLFLHKAPRTFVFGQEDYVAHLLARAEAAGGECRQRAVADLEASATLGMFSGIPGQPFPEHVAMLERASILTARLSPGSATSELYERLADHARTRIRQAEIDREELEN
jgi:hypothetical protein